MSNDDWRVIAEVSGDGGLDRLLEGIRATEVAQEARSKVPAGVVVSHDGDRLFLYGATRSDVETARAIVEALAGKHDLHHASFELQRWHHEEERWEPAGEPLPDSPDEHRREHEELMAGEAAESRERGYGEWEVDIELPSRHEAVEFARKLEAEGIPHRRNWTVIRVEAATEDDAKALAERLSREAPADAHVTGPLGNAADAWQALHPFAFLGGLAN